MKKIENNLYKKITKEEAEIFSKMIVEEARNMAIEYDSDPRYSPYPFIVGVLQETINRILRNSKLPVWDIEDFQKKFESLKK
jgi:hypothetical protein